MHILMVEDDLDLGRALRQGLNADGITGEWVRRAADAAHLAANATFHCVVIDVSLPDGTGYDLLGQWRQAGLNLPVIIIPARSALEERLVGFDQGADDAGYRLAS